MARDVMTVRLHLPQIRVLEVWCVSEFDAEMGSRINLCMMVLSFTREGASDGCGAFAEVWGGGWLRVPEQGSRPCWNR